MKADLPPGLILIIVASMLQVFLFIKYFSPFLPLLVLWLFDCWFSCFFPFSFVSFVEWLLWPLVCLSSPISSRPGTLKGRLWNVFAGEIHILSLGVFCKTYNPLQSFSCGSMFVQVVHYFDVCFHWSVWSLVVRTAGRDEEIPLTYPCPTWRINKL